MSLISALRHVYIFTPFKIPFFFYFGFHLPTSSSTCQNATDSLKAKFKNCFLYKTVSLPSFPQNKITHTSGMMQTLIWNFILKVFKLPWEIISYTCV